MAYQGSRLALFDFKLLQANGKTARLKCRIANTGRDLTNSKKNNIPPVIELDTLGIPPLLWGQETAISKAAAKLGMQLQPGEISEPVWLEVLLSAPPSEPLPPGACADLVLDTAYVQKYGETQIVLCAILKNIGNAPVEISGANALALHVYFVTGMKWTRGAIPAGEAAVEKGRETLTGWLMPGQKMQWTTTADLKKRSKFAPNLVLELAPPPDLQECDRTNNFKAIELAF